LLHLLEADPGWHDPPVVLVSAEPSQPGVAEALAGGRAVRMVAKPFDVDELISVMHEAINKQ